MDFKNGFQITLTKEMSAGYCREVRFIPRQKVSKKIVAVQYPEVRAWRYECVVCGTAFRESALRVQILAETYECVVCGTVFRRFRRANQKQISNGGNLQS